MEDEPTLQDLIYDYLWWRRGKPGVETPFVGALDDFDFWYIEIGKAYLREAYLPVGSKRHGKTPA